MKMISIQEELYDIREYYVRGSENQKIVCFQDNR